MTGTDQFQKYVTRLIIPKILIASKNLDIKQQLVSYTQQHINNVSSIGEALAVVDDTRPVLLITDCILADGTGIDLAFKLIERNINCTNILIIDNDDCSYIQSFREQIRFDNRDCLFQVMLKTPVTTELLNHAVDYCINGSSQ